MERRTQSDETMREGIVAEGRSGHAFPSLLASEQFSTRSCARCTGLLVSEWCYDLNNAGAHRIESFRCVQCGDRIDPVILQNRYRLSVERQPLRKGWPRHTVNSVLLSEVA